jgi:protein TonB
MSAVWIDDSLVRARSDGSIDGPIEPPRNQAPDSTEIADELPLVKPIRTHEHSARTSPPHAEDKTDIKAAIKLTVGVLTTDSSFANQLRASLDHTPIVTIDNLDAIDKLAECQIVITDLATTRTAIEALTLRLRSHDPATAVIAAGKRDESAGLFALQSTGVVDAFLLKPLTTAATRLVIEGAKRRYRSTDDEAKPKRKARHVHPKRRALVPAVDLDSSATTDAERAEIVPQLELASPPAPPPTTSRMRPAWMLFAAIVLVASGAMTWGLTQRTSGIDPAALVAKHLALADSAFVAGRLLDSREGAAQHYQTVLALDPTNLAAQRGLDAIAQSLSRRTQAHMAARELADAVIALAQLREFNPEYAELQLLETQLQQLQDSFAAMHIAKLEAPSTAPSSPVLPAPRKAVPPVRRETAPPEADTPAAIDSPRSSAPSPIEPAGAADQTLWSARNEQPVFDVSSSAAEEPPSAPIAETASLPLAESSRDELVASLNGPSPVRSPPIVSQSEEPAPRSPKLVKYVAPEFPAIARDRGLTGWVMLSLEIAPDGRVHDATIEDAVRRQIFGKAALAAARQWRYEPDPTRRPGDRTNVRVEFKLE